MKSKALYQALLALALLTVAGVLFMRSCRGPQIDLDPYLALGTYAADEAASLVGGKGHLVAVVPDSGPDVDPAFEALFKAFKGALKAHRGVDVQAVEPIRLDPFTRMQTGGAVPPEMYLALRRRHPDAAGVVLFMGFPPLSEDEVESIGKGPTKVLVVSARLPSYPALLRNGAIDVAIVSRAGNADQAGAKPASLKESFEQENEILRGRRVP